MQVKICGITSVEDALAAADAGADAIGLNFVSGPRMIDVNSAEEILRFLPPFVMPVALVRLESRGVVGAGGELLASSRVGWLQPYGDITSDAITGFAAKGYRFLGPCRTTTETLADGVASWQATYRAANAVLLLDAFHPSMEGGAGERLDWRSLADAKRAGVLDGDERFMLAGGLTPENVAEAVKTVQPWGVDVSSGVESSPGRKCPEKMRAFVRAAKSAFAA